MNEGRKALIAFVWLMLLLVFIALILPLIGCTSKTYNTDTGKMSINDTITDTLVIDTVDYYEEAIEHLKAHEGFRSKIYLDVDGARTIGYGHHLLKNENYQNISEAKATLILKEDVNSRLEVVKANYDVTGTQALALTLFSFNLGLGGLKKAVNSGMLDDIEKIKQYCHYSKYIDGVRHVYKKQSLLQRREYELRLFLINKQIKKV